jgi:Raf kinase inhibitor-like YbhB/YbcL family protein
MILLLILYVDMKFRIQGIDNDNKLNKRYTCKGENINPSIEIDEVPSSVKSLALTVTDPDAPSGHFIHWLVWNISPERKTIEEDFKSSEAKEGINGRKEVGYTGPCPPSGDKPHRYFFQLYALDTVLSLETGASFEELREAMANKIIDQGEVIALYNIIKEP